MVKVQMILGSWNVNGIQSVVKKGFFQSMASLNPDCFSIQEVKTNPQELKAEEITPKGYFAYWHAAQKRGYSGVAVFTKKEALAVQYGIGVKEIDDEGRVLQLEFPQFILVNAYFPSTRRDLSRLPYKLFFCKEIQSYLKKLRKKEKNIIVCGDYNIAHQEIDIRNPKGNQKSAGFLPEERSWMTQFLASGWRDPFRELHPEPLQYTWWSYRPTVRERNIGWRIDYFTVNTGFMHRVIDARHYPHIMGSDHCPITLELEIGT